MKTDINGTSSCPPGEERYETFFSMASGRKLYQYDYRSVDGVLFSTIAPDLDVCRKRRDIWLQK